MNKVNGNETEILQRDNDRIVSFKFDMKWEGQHTENDRVGW